MTITETIQQWEAWKHYSELRPSRELIAGIDALLSTSVQRERQMEKMREALQAMHIHASEECRVYFEQDGAAVGASTCLGEAYQESSLCEKVTAALQPTAASESVQEVGALDQAPGSAGKLKNEISLILLSVCRESEPRYRLDGYIRWGLVEREIHEAIDAAIRPTNQAEP